MLKLVAAGTLTAVMLAAAMFSDDQTADRLGVAGDAAQAITYAMRSISLDPTTMQRDQAGSPGPNGCASRLCAGGLPSRVPPAAS